MGIAKETLQEIKDLRQQFALAKASNMGISVAKTRYINGLYNNADMLISAAEEYDAIQSELAAVKEERDLFESTLAKQDAELAKLRKAAKAE